MLCTYFDMRIIKLPYFLWDHVFHLFPVFQACPRMPQRKHLLLVQWLHKTYFELMATFLFDCYNVPFNQREKNLLAFSKEQNLRPDVGYQENCWVKTALMYCCFSQKSLINWGLVMAWEILTPRSTIQPWNHNPTDIVIVISFIVIAIFLGHFCSRGKGGWGYPYVKHQPTKWNNTKDSHNTGNFTPIPYAQLLL